MLTKNIENNNQQDNRDQKFNFSFFTSGDNHQIRWGNMAAQRASSDTAKTKGVILLLNGRTEFMEKYSKVALNLSSLGYQVMSLDWRGQGLSVRELKNRDKGYIRDFQIYLDDLEIFCKLHLAPLKVPVTIIAHSMGGHIALRFMAQYSNTGIVNFKKVILISPMIDIITLPVSGSVASLLADWGSRQIAHIAIIAGLETKYIAGGTDYCKDTVKFENNVLTHDYDNFWMEHKEIEKNRNLALGGVTWGWLNAAFYSIDMLRSKKYLSAIKTPVWIFSAEEDRVVSNRAQQIACRMLSKGHFISIHGARHEILFESEHIKKVLWDQLLELLEK